MAFGLGAVIAAGQLQMAESNILQLNSIYTNMMTSAQTSIASQQKTLMDAASGIGSAYSNGASGMLGAVYSTNNEMGNIFKKAGGH